MDEFHYWINVDEIARSLDAHDTPILLGSTPTISRCHLDEASRNPNSISGSSLSLDAKWLNPHPIRHWWSRLKANWPQAHRVAAIRVLSIEAPNRTISVGQTIKLRCRTNGDKLHSLSWSRNGQEFYRFQPFERRQQHLFFNLTGVTVDVSRRLTYLSSVIEQATNQSSLNRL